MNDPRTLPEQWYEAHEKWSRADEVARMADEMVKLVESELFNHAEGSSAEAKKHWVREQERYRKVSLDAVTKRTTANLAWGVRKKLEMAMEVWRTIESSRRAEMQLR